MPARPTRRIARNPGCAGHPGHHRCPPYMNVRSPRLQESRGMAGCAAHPVAPHARFAPLAPSTDWPQRPDARNRTSPRTHGSGGPPGYWGRQDARPPGSPTTPTDRLGQWPRMTGPRHAGVNRPDVMPARPTRRIAPHACMTDSPNCPPRPVRPFAPSTDWLQRHDAPDDRTPACRY